MIIRTIRGRATARRYEHLRARTPIKPRVSGGRPPKLTDDDIEAAKAMLANPDSNELPDLSDASGALANRFIVLTMHESFLGREDLGLLDRLLVELPGILNWAIEGWRRLRDRGRFVMPASSADMVQQLADLGAPVGAFVRDRCVVDAGCTIETYILYLSWCDWFHINLPNRVLQFAYPEKSEAITQWN